jgi:hypothetical protein
MNNDWTAFDEQTERDVGLWRAYLSLWRLEVISTRCTWQLWPNEATRRAYVHALAEKERCEATVIALSTPVRRAPRPEPLPD